MLGVDGMRWVELLTETCLLLRTAYNVCTMSSTLTLIYHECPSVGSLIMPKGPNGEIRPDDANSCAVMVAKIATGEIKDEREEIPDEKIHHLSSSGHDNRANRSRAIGTFC